MSRKVIKNATWLTGQKLLLNIISVFFIGYLAKSVGVEDYGKFIFSLSFVSMFAILGNLGTRTVATKEIAANKDIATKVFSNFFSLRLKLSVVLLLVLIIATILMPKPDMTKTLIYIAIFSQIFSNLYVAPNLVFEAFEEMHYIVIIDSIARILVIAACLLGLYLNRGIITIALCYACGNLLEIFFSFYVLRKKFFAFGWDQSHWICQKELLKKSIPYAFAGIFGLLLSEVDKVMLSFMQNDYSVGIYGAAFALTSRAIFLVDSITTALFPAIVKLIATQNIARIRKIFTKTIIIFLAITAPIAFGVNAIAPQIIDTIYNSQEFVQASIPLKILIWTLPFSAFNLSCAYVLISKDMGMLLAKTNAALLLLNIILNTVLIEQFSFTGVAVTTLLCTFAKTIVYAIISWKEIMWGRLVKYLLSLIVANMIMFVVAFYFVNYNIWLSICAAVLVYVVACGFLPIVRQEALIIFKRSSQLN